MPDATGDSDLYLTDISPNDKPWDVHRAIASEIEGLYATAGLQNYADRIKQCSRLLAFNLRVQEDGSFRLKLHTAHFCHVRHCAICQWRKSLMWRARFLKALPEAIRDYPKHRFIFLTLTVKNCPIGELRATINHMNQSWKRMSQRKIFPAVGWVKSVEVTRSQDDSAHPHFHCLMMVKPSYFSTGYLSQAEWTDLWKGVLRVSYTPIVNIKVVKDKKGDRSLSESGLVPVHAILETLKYTVKPQDLVGAGNSDPAVQMSNAEWLEQLTLQLRNTKAVAVGGIFKNYLSEEEPEDLIGTDEEEVSLSQEDIEIWFGWREMVKRYRKVER